MKTKTKLKARYGGSLKRHWQWSVILAFTLLILDGILLLRDRKSGYLALVFTVVYLAAVLLIYLYFRPRILRETVAFAARYEQVEKELLQELEIPAALLEPDGHVLWMNDRLALLTEKNVNFRKNISTLFPEINRGALPVSGMERDIRMIYKEKDFRVHIQRIPVDQLIDESSMVEIETGTSYLYMVYLFDETELRHYIQENRDQKPVIGLVNVDNYEEVMERTDEIHQSLLGVMVERKISKYFTAADGLVKKLEKDKYLILLSQKGLDGLREDRFSVLDGVKTISIGNDINMTVSGGFGVNGKGFLENYEFARGAIEMALGRGGDQVVLRDGEDMTFYGGKTQHSEKSTRVKARVKAQALRELILSSENVVAMGHQLTDMDSFGAAVGVCRAAMSVGKEAHIVLGELNTNIRDWVTRFKESRDYSDDFFITHEEAIEMVQEGTAVVVVDTSRPGICECPQILKQTKSVVVLDHHRQTTDTIENAALSYIEPIASSACEMIAEILQYFEDNVRMKSLEADCIYAGIIIDTNSFVAKTGVRTFEAAAYLRRCGADVSRVRKALRDNFDSYMAKMDAVSHAEKYMDSYALSTCNGEGLENPSVVGAQAANELLNIVGVRASFVATRYKEKVFISARSIDEVNVQLVMERMGGGGHLNIAGAQLTDATPEEAIGKIKETLKQMTEEGEI